MLISDKARRFLEISANVAIIVVAIIVVRNLVWSIWQPKQQLQAPQVGTKVSLPGIKWDEGTTLVMVLQKGCRYCEESSPFYHRLREQRSGSQPRMVAVVSGDETEIAGYLSQQGITVDDLVNASPSDINVLHTPTLLLVDRSGKVMEVWVGKLDAGREPAAAQRILTSH